MRGNASFPGRSAARSSCGAVRCRAGAAQGTVFVTIPVLRSSASQGLRHSASKTRVNALMASRPGNVPGRTILFALRRNLSATSPLLEVLLRSAPQMID